MAAVERLLDSSGPAGPLVAGTPVQAGDGTMKSGTAFRRMAPTTQSVFPRLEEYMQQVSRSLRQVVTERPFPEYQAWWPLGNRFVRFMADAVVAEWAALPGTGRTLKRVSGHVEEYVHLVYDRDARPGLVDAFTDPASRVQFASGEFDALSYAFFRAAFEALSASPDVTGPHGASKKRGFTKRVGRRFFGSVASHLDLELPRALDHAEELRQLKGCLARVGGFLVAQGYLRTHFGFRFTLDVAHAGQPVEQTDEGFLDRLRERGRAYALYEMGYPVILPSAVYLFNTMGEAQHHSSRTIEELFERVGYAARETDDFDPSLFASDHVVERWVIERGQ